MYLVPGWMLWPLLILSRMQQAVQTSRRDVKTANDKVSSDKRGKTRFHDKSLASPSSQLLQKQNPSNNGLPMIHINSGPNIIEIRSQILIYCQQRGIGKIANCLEVGSYDGMEEVVVDNALLGEIADPHKMQRDLYMELKKIHWTRSLKYFSDRCRAQTVADLSASIREPKQLTELELCRT